ncbi:DUF1214 domain-containing protein [Halieaceae bacterium IMCC14734]|uniref:DUF1214 domain-containing protein n=1 Tax=Candidatus Litorirhabdus singularis TaxID=2518993 RepID=A0ABT3TEH8_9GAMM|nr:DUF1214 domain-containing protein [Candidatus Litorirhabdus singularis]MCX2980225.1 DUF1214 domain-containing protein [Candidatus Litorirhabdus singularis]
MIKKILLFFITLGVGLYLGYQLPRGAGAVSALMNMGGRASDNYAALESHQALLEYEAVFAAARKMVLTDARSEQEAIEGMRWLLRVVAMSAEVAADANPRQPHFQRMDTLVRKVGGDNPDAEYEHVTIDGRYDYRITGNVGSVRYLGFTFNAGQGMTPRRQFDYLSDQTLTLDEHGNFTILLAQDKPDAAGDWVQMPADASGILVRQYIADRSREVLPTLHIEILGPQPDYQPPSDEEVAGAIVGTTFAFLKLTTLHRTVLPELLNTHNEFVRATSENLGGAISSEDNLYMLASYQLGDDEALMITVQPPQTRYWNLVAETRWHEIYDYLHRPTSLTLEQVEYAEDGSVEFVIAHADPGHPNWIDTSGHNFGFLTLRWLDSKEDLVPLPQTRVVKWASLQSR